MGKATQTLSDTLVYETLGMLKPFGSSAEHHAVVHERHNNYSFSLSPLGGAGVGR